ncbi:MAG: hypothetical protein ACE5GS_00785 [Kiloniellaceae bacterium]
MPRTFDLAHVQPEHFTVALGKDPARIFAFVRDRIAYEVYTGYLRGPRGTLLALAGNSVDQAALLGSLLEHAGQRVQYVRAELTESAAKTLVDSMWAERPRAAPARTVDEPSPEVAAALETLRVGVERDYNLILGHLKRAGHRPGPEAATSLASLVEEARDHYWVQWWKDGAWVDLDPTFDEASLGERFARADETFESFPEGLFHRVEIRIRLEEYTGNSRSERVILEYKTKAADLSGADLVLSYVRENWKGPARGLKGAIAAAIEDTGRVKPVLLLDKQDWIAGEPFRQRPPARRGLGGIKDILSGAGTRDPVPIATAASIEFDFLYPDGRREAVVRALFDRIGKSKRASGNALTAEEVRAHIGSDGAFDVSKALYDLFFTTGRLDGAHAADIASGSSPKKGGAAGLREGLRNLTIGFAATSDALLGRLRMRDGVKALVYPDSPRVFVAEVVKNEKTLTLTLDLRRDRARVLALGSRPDHAFSVRVARGVVEGTLERAVVEFVTARGRADGPGPSVSTSSLLERARDEGVPTMLFGPGGPDAGAGIGGDALVRVREDLAGGFFVVGPDRTIALGAAPRYAWWRIDPRTGETTAVTDEGLHANGAEYWIINDEEAQETEIIVMEYVGDLPGAEFGTTVQTSVGTFQWGTEALGTFVHQALGSGEVVNIVGGLPPYLFL